MNPVVQTRGLSVRRAGRVVLADVDLRAEAGEFVSIVGVSGAGKSTLLHALAGHLPFSGDVIAPDRIGMVFQHHAVFPWMTVWQNISFGVHWKEKEAIGNLVRISGLQHKADAYPSSLSGGERQRVAVARAIAPAPDLLLMDEPFGSLDARTREHMQSWLRYVGLAQNMTVILVTHDLEEALLLSDRIVLLSDGRIQRTFGGFRATRMNDIRYSDDFVRLRREISGCLRDKI